MGASSDDLSHLGDPAELRALAAELTLGAESIAQVGVSLARRVEEMTFEGPAALRLRDVTDERQRRADRAAIRLQDASLVLRRAAAQVEEQVEETTSTRARAVDPDDPR